MGLKNLGTSKQRRKNITKQYNKENLPSFHTRTRAAATERQIVSKKMSRTNSNTRLLSSYLVRVPHPLLYPRMMLTKEETISDPCIVLIMSTNLCNRPHHCNRGGGGDGDRGNIKY